MMFGQYISIHRIFKRPAKALVRLRVCADWSEPFLLAHTTLFEISCHGSIIFSYHFFFQYFLPINIGSLSGSTPASLADI